MAKTLTGSEIIVELLLQNSIKTVAGIPGGSILPLYDELYRSSIKHVLVRHEQAAGFIAQGMARVSGKAAVCLATSGPGAMNLLTAIADARCDSIPVVAITGQVNTDLIGTDAFQEADTFGLSFPITKHSILIKNAEELLTAIPLAFAVAESGRPGPVLIDVPRNVQLQKCTVPDDFDTSFQKIYDECVKQRRVVKYQTEKSRAEAVIEQFCIRLLSSKKPVIYVGGGANNPRAAQKIDEFLKIFPSPVVASLMGIGTIDTARENWLGMVGMHGSYVANRAMYDADTVLAIGSRFDDRATGVVSKFCPNASILHIDIDAAEVNKILVSDSFLIEDAATALSLLNAQLAPAVKNAKFEKERSEWLSLLVSLKKEEKISCKMNCDSSECCGEKSCGAKKGVKFFDPRVFISDLEKKALENGVLSEKLLVTTDVGQHQMWTAQFFPVHRPRQLLTSGSLGTMGFGLPSAIGAALASPDSRVICISGDGSILMNIQELATLSELNLNVTVIVLENGALGMVRQQQEYLFEKRYSASTFAKNPDLLSVASGFGIRTANADSDADWAKRAFGEAGPCFVRASVARFENVLPFVKAGFANIDSIR